MDRRFSVLFLFLLAGVAACNTNQADSTPLSITSVLPGLVSHDNDTEIIVTGTGFSSGMQFLFNGNPVNQRLVSSDRFYAWLPANVGLCGRMKLAVRKPSTVKDQPDEYTETDQLFTYYTHSALLTRGNLVLPDAGFNASLIAAGDFNQDQKTDMVTLDSSSGNLFVAWGQDGGTWAKPVQIGPTDMASVSKMKDSTAMVAGDVDGDKALDLVFMNPISKQVAFLKGHGNETFDSNVSAIRDGLAKPAFLSLADLNGDGKSDGVFFDQADTKKINVQTSLSMATSVPPLYTATMDFPPTSRPERALVSMDLDGDKVMDVVAFYSKDGQSTTVHALFGDGKGGLFPSKYPGTVPFLVQSAASGDFNFDGIQDVAVIDDSRTLHVLLGDGDGSFKEQPRSFLLEAEGNSIVIQDFNGDGKSDVAVALKGGSIRVLTNQCSSD